MTSVRTMSEIERKVDAGDHVFSNTLKPNKRTRKMDLKAVRRHKEDKL